MQKRMLITIVSSSILGALLIISFATVFMVTRQEEGSMMAADVDQLETIFRTIHETCGIASFDFQKNPINFLNVVRFVGSEVGPMNLMYPQRWKGPYLQNNPTMQGKEYQVVRTVHGHFITPGEGVKLPSGKVVGKDILLDEAADIPSLMRDTTVFLYKDKFLAAEVPVGRPIFGLGDPS